MKLTKGSMLVEAVITISIFLAIILAIYGTLTAMLKASTANIDRIKAAYLAEEGIEVMRILRDRGWSANIASQPLNSPFYLYFDGTSWSSTSTPEVVDGIFERSIIMSSVSRDASFDIVSSGGNPDDNTRLVTVQVFWYSAVGTTTKSISTYFTNVFKD